MQDQVTNLKVKNINAVYLGSAQLDKKVESDAFLPHSEYSVIFVTPAWIAKEENCAKIQKLVQAENLSLIAIDEAHLFHLWQEFRLSYKKRGNSNVWYLVYPLIQQQHMGHQTEPVTLKLSKTIQCRRMIQLPKEVPQTVMI